VKEPSGAGSESGVDAAAQNPGITQERRIPRRRTAGGIERIHFTENYLSEADISFSINKSLCI
jgi:hypothetical protein